MPIRRRRAFIPIEPNRTTKWTCTIDGTNIKPYILSASFPHGLISEELVCEIELDNSGEDFTDAFTYRDVILFKLDFGDASTVQFTGEIEEIKKKINNSGYILSIKGAHFTSQLLDIMVTEKFEGANLSDIRKSLIDNYLTGFTYTNIEENTTTTDIEFVKKPLLDCFLALDLEGDEDTYLDFDKDFHTFVRESKENLSVHVTKHNLFELKGLGTDSADVRNKITVYGEAGGLPVIHTSEDSASQTTYRAKESIITDTSIVDETQAKTVGDAEKTQLKDPLAQGSSTNLLWPNLNPGDKIYVISNPHKIHDLFRVVKFVFRMPNETMEIFYNQERSIPKLFKDRIKKDMAQETNVNPNKMTNSYNFTFDNETKIDAASSSNYIVSDSFARKGSGETGVIVSNKKETNNSVTSVHVVAIGETLDGAKYFIQANSQAEFQEISLDTLEEVDETGTDLKLKIEITNADTRIDSVALLYK